MATTKIVPGAAWRPERLWAVSLGGKEIGFITKFRNTRTDTHPWKCYLGKGETAQFLGVAYQGLAYAAQLVEDELHNPKGGR